MRSNWLQRGLGCAPSRSSVAATPSSCAKCRLPAAPPDQPASASKCEGTPAVESHSILVLVCVGAGCCGRCVCGSCCVCCHPAASCVAAAVAERVTYGCVDIWMCKSIALKLRCLRVAYLLEVLHSISREAVLRTAAAPFELPG